MNRSIGKKNRMREIRKHQTSTLGRNQLCNWHFIHCGAVTRNHVTTLAVQCSFVIGSSVSLGGGSPLWPYLTSGSSACPTGPPASKWIELYYSREHMYYERRAADHAVALAFATFVFWFGPPNRNVCHVEPLVYGNTDFCHVVSVVPSSRMSMVLPGSLVSDRFMFVAA